MSTIIYNGIEYEVDDSHSALDRTGRNLQNNSVMDNTTIVGTCFSQETPDTHVFRDNLTGVTFINCNLDNVFLPPGNEAIDCSQRRFQVQVDGRDWIVDENLQPVEPLDIEYSIQHGLNTDPNKILPQ